MSGDQSWGSRPDGSRAARTPANMSRDRRRKAPADAPPHPLRCPFCSSGDMDEEARECRACRTAVPHGINLRPNPNPTSTTREWRITTAGVRQGSAAYSARRWQR